MFAARPRTRERYANSQMRAQSARTMVRAEEHDAPARHEGWKCARRAVMLGCDRRLNPEKQRENM